MAITAQKIAELAGVSRGTVDRALKNRTGVNPETKEKILEIARKYNYKPNLIGKAYYSGCFRFARRPKKCNSDPR